MANKFKMPYGTTETYAEARRIKLILGLNTGGKEDETGTITDLIMQLLKDGEAQGFHGVEIDMLLYKKDN